MAEAWGKVANASGAVDVNNLKEWMGNVELVHKEVNQWVIQLEWELVNSQQDVVMLVVEQEQMGEWWEQIWNVIVDQTRVIQELTNFMHLVNKWAVVAQHGPGNLIMVDDREDHEREADELLEFYAHPVIPEDRVLREINKDEEDAPPDYVQ